MKQKETTLLLMFVVAFMAVAVMGVVLLLAFFFIFGGEDEVETPVQPGVVVPPVEEEDEPEVAAEVLTERVNAIAERIEGIDGIHSGATFGLYIGDDAYTVGKIPSGIHVVAGADEGTDFDIYIDTMETFEEIEAADDVCAKIRELRNSGEIQYELHASEMELFFKGYLSMEACIK